MAKLVTKNIKRIVVLILVFQLALLAVTRFTAWPEMLAWPYLLTEGWLPYKDIAIAHTPFLIVLLTFFYKIVGVGVLQLKLFSWIIILTTSILTFVVSKKLNGTRVALLSVIIFSVLQFHYDGNGLWFDHVLAPLFLLIYYLLLQKRYITAGLVWGIAVFTKQTSAWLVFPILMELYFLGSKKIMEMERRYVPFFYGTVIVIFTSTLLMYATKVLPYFTYWAIEFGVFTLPRASGQIDLPSIFELIKAALPYLPVVITIITTNKKKYILMFIWTIFAAIGTYPRWELFHFQPALPLLAIANAMAVVDLARSKNRPAIIAVSIVYLAMVILFFRGLIRNISPEIRFIEQNVQHIVEIVKDNSSENDRIYVVNYWDNIYALADRLPSVKPLVPYIPWYLEHNDMDQFVAAEVKAQLPKMIIRGDYGSGLSSHKIVGLEDTISKYYSVLSSSDEVTIFIKNQ